MKVIGIFISIFLIFAIIGFRQGVPQERANMREPNLLRQQAFQPIDLSCRLYPEQGTCDLTYSYKDKILYPFDPQTNTLNKTTYANKLELENGFMPKDLPYQEILRIVMDLPRVRRAIEAAEESKEAKKAKEAIKHLLSAACSQRRGLCLVAFVGVLIIFGGLRALWARRSQKANNNENDNIQKTHLPTKEDLEKFGKQTHTPA
jgi:hypothetical protein